MYSQEAMENFVFPDEIKMKVMEATLRVKSTIEPQVFAFANFFSRQKRL